MFHLNIQWEEVEYDQQLFLRGPVRTCMLPTPAVPPRSLCCWLCLSSLYEEPGALMPSPDWCPAGFCCCHLSIGELKTKLSPRLRLHPAGEQSCWLACMSGDSCSVSDMVASSEWVSVSVFWQGTVWVGCSGPGWRGWGSFAILLLALSWWWRITGEAVTAGKDHCYYWFNLASLGWESSPNPFPSHFLPCLQ